ncbi:hypothetical protein F8M41_003568 [Gigaspora margarita]|uniref:Uncharacterized protein n=1 Tax=Gigaspora margarita TaxID=4874 RepID=A0A8H3XCN6_GIGMA|nr:hypothetical protein F8M41_003568 [Gigaspora margarita]
MEDKLTIAALEVDIDFPNLKVEYSFSPFNVECTTTTVIEVEEALSNLEVGFTSPILEIEKTLSSLYTETTPIYTYQPSEVTPLNSTHQHIALDDVHNHELQPGQIAQLNARYQQLSTEMMEDL